MKKMILLNEKKNKLLFFDRSRNLQRKLLNIHFNLVKLKFNVDNRVINIYKRSTRIIDYFVGKRLFIYNGKIFRKVLITKNHIGFLVGNFSFTRRYGMGVDMHRRRKKKLK